MSEANSTPWLTPSEAKGFNSKVTHDGLKSLLRYDPESGDFTWIRHSNRVDLVGSIAGVVRKDAVEIKILGTRYKAHRLAWFYVTGEWPYDVIDHVDGNPLNNRWSNLRSVDRSINSQNRRSRAIAKNGGTDLGVYLHKKSGKYQASIAVTLAGKKVHLYLGLYATESEARDVYIDAKRLMHHGCTL